MRPNHKFSYDHRFLNAKYSTSKTTYNINFGLYFDTRYQWWNIKKIGYSALHSFLLGAIAAYIISYSLFFQVLLY